MPSRKPKKRIIVIGGGYAGLSVILDLARSDEPEFEILLIDKRHAFLELVHLHKTVHTALQNFQVSYQALAERYGFQFCGGELAFDERTPAEWRDSGSLSLDTKRCAFDYLVICTGGGTPPLEANTSPEFIGNQLINLAQLKTTGAAPLLQRFLEETAPVERSISVIGGGASGIQFLFELDDFLRLKRQDCELNLVNADTRLLANLPPPFHDYTEEKILSRKSTINYLPDTKFILQDQAEIELEDGATGKRFIIPSRLTLLFPGLSAQPVLLNTTPFGQVYSNGKVLPEIFSAGDCADYEGSGLNTLSAQAAVHKGKAIAENIRRHALGLPLAQYDYQELGYFVSLGPGDGIGWMLFKSNVITGIPAFAIKEAIEAQFSLFLGGFDTYVDPLVSSIRRYW